MIRKLGSVGALLTFLAWPAYGQGPTHTMNNGRVEIGIDSSWGGAITLLRYVGYSLNFVNNGFPDTGRSIQVSLYNGTDTYSDGWPCDGGAWGWNPVQAGTMSSGSCGVVGSGVNALSTGSGWMYSSTQPYHWNPNLGRSNVTIEQTVEFVGGYNNVVKISYQVTNHESYTIAAGHEAPVAYLINNPFDRRVAYTGSSPWSYGGVSEVGTGNPNSTEPWIGVFRWDDDASDYVSGIALYVPDGGAAFNFESVSGGAHAVQNWRNFGLAPNDSVAWVVYLVLGDLNEIRSTIYALAGH